MRALKGALAGVLVFVGLWIVLLLLVWGLNENFGVTIFVLVAVTAGAIGAVIATDGDGL